MATGLSANEALLKARRCDVPNSDASQPASAGLLEFMRRAAHCGFPQLAQEGRRQERRTGWRRGSRNEAPKEGVILHLGCRKED